MSATVNGAATIPDARMRPRTADMLLALGAAAVFLVVCAVRGFPSLADMHGDNDSVMRLVEVRDLLAGQGWFDTMQYRMGLEGGFQMHWSRLVDLPIVTLIATFETVTGNAGLAETLALVAWPTGLYCLALYLIIRTARTVGGEWSVLPATVIGALTLYFTGIFTPGALDHHNVQLVLALATFLLLIRARDSAIAAPLAGLCTAALLAVAMEGAPYVAIAGAVVSGLFLFGDREDARIAARFGTAFALFTALALSATVPVSAWFAERCDALSLPQASLALLGGGGLALIASVPGLGATRGRRAVALVALAVAVAALVAIAFPQCLADPYANLDERLRRYWINAIREVQSVVAVVRDQPTSFAGYYVTPLLALSTLGWHMVRQGLDRGRIILAALLAAATLVSFWQIRGGTFSLPVAAIVLSVAVGAMRRQSGDGGSIRYQLATVAVWALSVNMVWQATAVAVADAAGVPVEGSIAAENAPAECYANADYAQVAALPRGAIVTISNLGSSILRNTPHRALSGSYHRNNAGNLAVLDMLMGKPDDARVVAADQRVDYVLLCRGNAETSSLARWAPDGLMADLVAGKVPGWLEIVPETAGEVIEVYRVDPAGT